MMVIKIPYSQVFCRQLLTYLLVILLQNLFNSVSFAQKWQVLSSGIEYQDLILEPLKRWSHIHVFRIHLQDNHFELARAEPSATVHQLAHQNLALIGLNGGFFDEQYRPLGLRISQYQRLNPAKPISWWGVFYIVGQKAFVSNLRHYPAASSINFAIQSGPRLIVHGKIPRLKAGYAERSALGITAHGNVVILVTENAPLTTTDLAHLMRSSPLNCIDALNLDGGSSSQLYTRIASFYINSLHEAPVSDAILVKSKPLKF